MTEEVGALRKKKTLENKLSKLDPKFLSMSSKQLAKFKIKKVHPPPFLDLEII